MNISNKLTHGLLSLYASANKLGLLDNTFTRSLYINAYFLYKKYLEDSYAKLIKHHPHLFQGGNIIDIGANIGYTAYVFSKVIKRPYQIYAFEPEKNNFTLLQQVSKKFRFTEYLIPIAAAVGEKNCDINLWKNETHNGDHRILTDALKNHLGTHISVQTVPMVTIDEYLKTHGNSQPVSFIKIDIQGYELAASKGMIETLARYPNAVIGFEYCPSIIKSLGFCPEELLQFFQHKGYNFFYLNKSNQIEKYNLTHIRQDNDTVYDYVELICARGDLSR